MLKRCCLLLVLALPLLQAEDAPLDFSGDSQNKSGLLFSLGGGVGYSTINITSAGAAFPNLFGKIIAQLGSSDGINLFNDNPRGELSTILNGAVNLKVGYQKMFGSSLGLRGYGNAFGMFGAAILPGHYRQNYFATNGAYFRDDDYDNIYLPMTTLDFTLNLDAIYYFNTNFGVFAGLGIGFSVDPMGFVASSMLRGSGLLLGMPSGSGTSTTSGMNGFYNGGYSGSVDYVKMSIPLTLGVTLGSQRHKFEAFIRIPTLSSGIDIRSNPFEATPSFISTKMRATSLIFSYTFIL